MKILICCLFLFVSVFEISAFNYSTPIIVQCKKCNGEGYKRCNKCKGNGYKEKKGQRENCKKCDGERILTCNYCKGAGRVKKSHCLDCTSGYNICYHCHGNGNFGKRLVTVKCKTCNGSKQIRCTSCGGHRSTQANCKKCSKTGKITCTICKNGVTSEYENINCTVCHGMKRLLCKSCRGNYNKTDYIKIESDLDN